MKLLWVKSDFLHPTTRGGQIRTLEMLRRLHARHQVHYLAYHDPDEREGVQRSSEYCSHAWPVPHRAPRRTSPRFVRQLAAGLVSKLPVSIRLYHTAAMANLYERLVREHRYDCVVCDFLTPAPNLSDLERCVLFQHNVEYVIWRRHADNAPTPAHRLFFDLQARRMFEYEREVCRRVRKVIAVSETDAATMSQAFGIDAIEAVPTGVDVDFFKPQAAGEAPKTDIVFVGSMDWMPNTDGVLWFAREILPLIRARRPQTSVTVVGRRPSPEIRALSSLGITVTNTVADVRPYLWGSLVSAVPLRIGGGTRLKIFEAMAACTPVVSTTVGAEGLGVENGRHLLIADTPDQFAQACLKLIECPAMRSGLAGAAQRHVADHYSWDAVTTAFERMLPC